jgi:hypothetical protein
LLSRHVLVRVIIIVFSDDKNIITYHTICKQRNHERSIHARLQAEHKYRHSGGAWAKEVGRPDEHEQGGARASGATRNGGAPARGRHAPRGPATRACSSVAGKVGSPASIRSCARAPARRPPSPALPSRVTHPFPLLGPRGLECSTGGVLTRPASASRGSRQHCPMGTEIDPLVESVVRQGRQRRVWLQSSRHGLPPSVGAAKASTRTTQGPGLAKWPG